jgi:hypothetical protein
VPVLDAVEQFGLLGADGSLDPHERAVLSVVTRKCLADGLGMPAKLSEVNERVGRTGTNLERSFALTNAACDRLEARELVFSDGTGHSRTAQVATPVRLVAALTGPLPDRMRRALVRAFLDDVPRLAPRASAEQYRLLLRLLLVQALSEPMPKGADLLTLPAEFDAVADLWAQAPDRVSRAQLLVALTGELVGVRTTKFRDERAEAVGA